jgi:transposase InsO family protein
MKELASERRRCGYRRLHILLKREGWKMNWKKLYRLYREEGLTIRKSGGRKRRRRFLPGTPISTSWRCLEMSMVTSKVEAVESVAVIAGLLSGVVVQNHC